MPGAVDARAECQGRVPGQQIHDVSGLQVDQRVLDRRDIAAVDRVDLQDAVFHQPGGGFGRTADQERETEGQGDPMSSVDSRRLSDGGEDDGGRGHE